VSWTIGYDSNWQRDVGYGVPATCDQPVCGKGIDRGLGYVCGGDPYGGEHGCGLYFCGDHLFYGDHGPACERCLEGQPPFEPTPDTAEWVHWKLTDPSWAGWRAEHPQVVAALKATAPRIWSNSATIPPDVTAVVDDHDCVFYRLDTLDLWSQLIGDDPPSYTTAELLADGPLAETCSPRPETK
jgi:hypothetical protein